MSEEPPRSQGAVRDRGTPEFSRERMSGAVPVLDAEGVEQPRPDGLLDQGE